MDEEHGDALDDAALDERLRVALRGYFEHSSAYLVNTGPVEPAGLAASDQITSTATE